MVFRMGDALSSPTPHTRTRGCDVTAAAAAARHATAARRPAMKTGHPTAGAASGGEGRMRIAIYKKNQAVQILVNEQVYFLYIKTRTF